MASSERLFRLFNQSEIYQICVAVGPQRNFLARALELCEGDIENINALNVSALERCYQVCLQWSRRTSNPTRKELLRALRSIDMTSLADSLDNAEVSNQKAHSSKINHRCPSQLRRIRSRDKTVPLSAIVILAETDNLDWLKLARHLCLPENDIFKINLEEKSTYDKIFTTVMKWQERYGEKLYFGRTHSSP